MQAFIFTIALFFFWGLIGSATLAVFPSRLRMLQNFMLAPAIGIAVTLIPVFLINRLGVPIKDFAVIYAIVLVGIALCILAIQRPLFPLKRLLPFLGILLVALFITANPMFNYGFDWVSYSNDDMANYCLGAQRFLNQGYFDIPNLKALLAGRDYSQDFWFMHVANKSRSGSELMLAFVWGATRLNAHQIFMPTICALYLALLCSGSALVAYKEFPRRAPLITMGLLAISPLTTLGVLYQLIGQVGGLGLLCAAIVLLYRKITIHSIKNLFASSVSGALIFGALFIWYPEALPFLGIGWLIFLGLSLLYSKDNFKTILVPALIIGGLVILLLGYFILTSLQFMLMQASGLQEISNLKGYIDFPYYLIPSGIAVLLGLWSIGKQVQEPLVSLSILFGIFILTWLIRKMIPQLRARYPAAIVTTVMLTLSAILFYQNNGFGLFKLAMYIQPFIIAVAAVELVKFKFKWPWIAYTSLLILIISELIAQNYYINTSRGEGTGGMNEIPHASAEKINYKFSNLMHSIPQNQPQQFVMDTANVVLAKFQALYTQGIRVGFPSRNFFESVMGFSDKMVNMQSSAQHLQSQGKFKQFIEQYKQEFVAQYHDVKLPANNSVNLFSKLVGYSLTEPHTALIKTLGKQVIFNNFNRSEPVPAEYFMIEKNPRNHLIFIHSGLGKHYYSGDRMHAAFFQLEKDPMFPKQLFSALGRYQLFMVMGMSHAPRMVFELTATVLKQFDAKLPSPIIWGANKVAVPFVGHGSGRVVSQPVGPAVVDADTYLTIDMGRDGKLFPSHKHGLMLLYGRDIPLDPRRLTVFGRDISLITEAEYQSMVPPIALDHFPEDLANKNLEYSGIYEDSWISERAFFVLQHPVGGQFLRISGTVPILKNSDFYTKLYVSLNGELIAVKELGVGPFDFVIPITAVVGHQRVDLKFTKYQHLPGDDGRIVGAKMKFIGFTFKE